MMMFVFIRASDGSLDDDGDNNTANVSNACFVLAPGRCSLRSHCSVSAPHNNMLVECCVCMSDRVCGAVRGAMATGVFSLLLV